MPLIETKGAASAQGFGLTLGGAEPVYIEQIFSTYLYTGNGSTQTINNGIDLAGKGGMVWGKSRSNPEWHSINDTVRGPNKTIQPNNTNAEASSDLTAFTSSGFSLGYITGSINGPGQTEVSWTFRKQPKFFDVVTYTGNGANRTIAHNLGSVPGFIIVKSISVGGNWPVYHQSQGATKVGYLNATDAFVSNPVYWNNTAPTSTVFSVGTDSDVNTNGTTYVAYLFAHNAGGFGLTGTDNVISCGSYTDGAGVSVNLGYEPQWLLVKAASTTSGWVLMDTMRGLTMTDDRYLQAQLVDAEGNFGLAYWQPTATGFYTPAAAVSPGTTMIYIAIRRGPMKVPTDGTTVFALSTWTGSGGSKDLGSQTNNFGTGYFAMLKARVPNSFGTNQSWAQFDQLRGSTPYLDSDLTTSEYTDPGGISIVNNRLQLNSGSYFGAGGDGTGQTYIAQIFRRAPGFFDEVCYTSAAGNSVKNHNLTVVPELIITKSRSAGSQWVVNYNFGSTTCDEAYLNSTSAGGNYSYSVTKVSATPTATQYQTYESNAGTTFVSYLFASCPGVSKVGSYTGTGATQTISCGFTGGARFVLIKRTDSTGDWYVWDTTRGMVAGTDPSLLLNSAAAEVNANSVYTTTGGFQIVSTAAGINASGGSYIYFSVA